jgi:competence transcription factor ComK
MFFALDVHLQPSAVLSIAVAPPIVVEKSNQIYLFPIQIGRVLVAPSWVSM